MTKHKIYNLVLAVMLILSVLPTASAHIDIVDIGHINAAQWDDIEGLCGYVDYQNMANHTIDGAILVFVDDKIVAGKILNMKIRYVAGFRCSSVKTFEFPITEAKGDHTITVYIYSMNNSVERTYGYNVEGVEDEIEVAIETEQEEDWLNCWRCNEK